MQYFQENLSANCYYQHLTLFLLSELILPIPLDRQKRLIFLRLSSLFHQQVANSVHQEPSAHIDYYYLICFRLIR